MWGGQVKWSHSSCRNLIVAMLLKYPHIGKVWCRSKPTDPVKWIFLELENVEKFNEICEKFWIFIVSPIFPGNVVSQMHFKLFWLQLHSSHLHCLKIEWKRVYWFFPIVRTFLLMTKVWFWKCILVFDHQIVTLCKRSLGRQLSIFSWMNI